MLQNFSSQHSFLKSYQSPSLLASAKLQEYKEDEDIKVGSAAVGSSSSGKIPVKRLVAGSVAGLADVWACHGFDRVKTHMQQHPHLSVSDAAKEIWHKGGGTAIGGLRSFYEGILPMSMEAFVKVGLRYFAFSWFAEEWKRKVQKTEDPNVHISVMGNLMGGLFAGTIESFIIVIPCELLKVRHMTQTSHESFYNVFKNVIKYEGVAALYKGGTSTYLRQVTNHMIRFPVFYSITNYLKEQRKTNTLPVSLNLTAGATAGIISTIINTPLDTLKTRQQKQGNNMSSSEIIKTIYKERGITAFWAGVVPRAIRVAPGQAITWAVFEKVLEMLGKD